MNSSKKISLDGDLKKLLSNYKQEEILFFEKIMEDVEKYKAETMTTNNIVVLETGSNG
jgi:hypothetical protein